MPVDLVFAMITVESGWNTWAYNPEPHYRYLWDNKKKAPFRKLTSDEIRAEYPPADFKALKGDADQEWWAQQASWGLMQVMGAVAREHGFEGPYLTQLCDPIHGLDYGCRHLARLHNRFINKYGWDGVIAAYNAGSPRIENGRFVNQDYLDKVVRAKEKS